MLCLASTVGVWSNEIVPAFVARGAQKRLRPAVSLISEEMKRCPMMVFGAIGAADLTRVPRMSWLHLSDFKAGGNDEFLGNEVRSAVTAVAHKEVLERAALVFALNDFPCFVPAALGAWIVRPLKGFLSHE